MSVQLRIAYIEIDTHIEIAENFRELLRDSKNILVDYYLSEKVLKLLEIVPNESTFKVSHSNLFSNLRNKQYDLVIIGTAHRYFNKFLEIVEYFPTAIIGHNFNFIQASQWDLVKSVFKKNWQFRLKLLLREGLLSKNKVYKRAKVIFALDEHIVSEKTRYLPLFYNKFLFKNQDDIFRIVIPGEVSQQRRDYYSVISRLDSLKVEKKLEIIFLGKASGKELKWIEEFNSHSKSAKIIYFTEKISQKIFDEWMKKSNVLWCPIQQRTEFFSIEEHYGKTKISGNINDAIKYAKRAVFPQEYIGKYFFANSENEVFEENLGDISKIFSEKYEKQKVSLELEKIIFNFVKNLKN